MKMVRVLACILDPQQRDRETSPELEEALSSRACPPRKTETAAQGLGSGAVLGESWDQGRQLQAPGLLAELPRQGLLTSVTPGPGTVRPWVSGAPPPGETENPLWYFLRPVDTMGRSLSSLPLLPGMGRPGARRADSDISGKTPSHQDLLPLPTVEVGPAAQRCWGLVWVCLASFPRDPSPVDRSTSPASSPQQKLL